MALKLFNPKAGLSIDEDIYILAGPDNPGYSTDSINAPVGSKYHKNDVNGAALFIKRLTGSGLDKWMQIEIDPDTIIINAVTNGLVVDKVSVDYVNVVQWIVTLALQSDQTRKQSFEILATHNGSINEDALQTTFSLASFMETGLSITDIDVQINLTGTGVDQTMDLYISSLVPITAYVKRSVIGTLMGDPIPVDISKIIFDISCFVEYTPLPDQIILNYAPTRFIRIPANFVSSRAICLTPPTNEIVFKIIKVDSLGVETEEGFLTIPANSTKGIFGLSNDIVITKNDRLKMLAPHVPDTTMSHLTITLHSLYV